MQDEFFTSANDHAADAPGRARPPPPGERRKNIVQLIGRCAHRHSSWQVFSDFVEMSAISFSNAVDLAQRETREARYLEVVKRYPRDELQHFPTMLAELTLAMEEEPDDVLGRVFHDLELHHKYAGQFFTPYEVCRMMARLTVESAGDVEERLKVRGYLTAHEPACGGGAMLIALAHELRELGVNYQRSLHVTAIDVDVKCVHMTYVQLALLHVPAIVIHGNSLSLEEYGRWYTPAHILGGWNWKLQREREPAIAGETAAAAPRSDPPSPGGPQLTLF